MVEIWCNYFLNFANNGLGWKFCFRKTEFPRFVLCWCYACHHETKRRICRFPAINFLKIILFENLVKLLTAFSNDRQRVRFSRDRISSFCFMFMLCMSPWNKTKKMPIPGSQFLKIQNLNIWLAHKTEIF